MVQEPRPLQSGLGHHERVVVDVGILFERTSLQFRQRVEPVVDVLLELGVVLLVVHRVVGRHVARPERLHLVAGLAFLPAVVLDARLVFRLQVAGQQLGDAGVDVASDGFDGQVRAFPQDLRAAPERPGADDRVRREGFQRRPVGRDEQVVRRGALGDGGDDEVGRLVGRDVLQRVDRGVDLPREDLLVETPDERAGLAESVNQFLAEFVAGRGDLD